MSDSPRACVVIDYQNIHLTAHNLFAPSGLPVYDSLIDPLRFAQRVLTVRAQRQRDETQKRAELASVRVFRGQASNNREPYLYGITQRHRSEWTRNRQVQVTYRTLLYPTGWPSVPAREKGIDVLVALTLTRLAATGEYDVMILATHDTDQEPALEIAAQDGRSKIETAGWRGARVLHPAGIKLWHTALTAEDMVQCRDRRDYRPPER